MMADPGVTDVTLQMEIDMKICQHNIRMLDQGRNEETLLGAEETWLKALVDLLGFHHDRREEVDAFHEVIDQVVTWVGGHGTRGAIDEAVQRIAQRPIICYLHRKSIGRQIGLAAIERRNT